MTAPHIERSAVISDDGQYRYELLRRWDARPAVTWVCLNPSTADADIDDPTLRRIQWFSRQEGYGACVVLNLFALRATDPTQLGRHADPVGPDNQDHLSTAVATAPCLVAAWGAHSDARARGIALRQSAAAIHRGLWCLGTTTKGAPRHPLYVPGTTRLELWR